MELLEDRTSSTTRTRRFVFPNFAIIDVRATAGHPMRTVASEFATKNV